MVLWGWSLIGFSNFSFQVSDEDWQFRFFPFQLSLENLCLCYKNGHQLLSLLRKSFGRERNKCALAVSIVYIFCVVYPCIILTHKHRLYCQHVCEQGLMDPYFTITKSRVFHTLYVLYVYLRKYIVHKWYLFIWYTIFRDM